MAWRFIAFDGAEQIAHQRAAARLDTLLGARINGP
jgi:hypothetical protein